MTTNSKPIWYQQPLGIIAMLIFFFPIGLYLMFKYANWTKKTKLIIATVVIIFVIIGVSSDKGQKSEPDAHTPSPSLTQTPTPIPSPSLAPVKQIKVDVESLIVKKVDNKYRYFFDIRNKDIDKFEGSVTIKLLKANSDSPLGEGTFNTKSPIEPKLGDSVYFDINTGPESVHGEYGIARYAFTVRQNGREVNSGSGSITKKLEDLGSL